MIAQLQEDGVDVYADDDQEDDVIDDDLAGSDIDVEAIVRRKAEEVAPDRIRFSVAAVTHEWRATKARYVAALREVGDNRCVLLQWNAKHPAL